jgi:hypothetical protein
MQLKQRHYETKNKYYEGFKNIFMEQSSSWEANNYSVVQEFPPTLVEPEVSLDR